MKKLVSLILALVMVLACSVAMAEPAKKGSANGHGNDCSGVPYTQKFLSEAFVCHCIISSSCSKPFQAFRQNNCTIRSA